MSVPAEAMGRRPRGDKVRGTLFYILLLISVAVGFILLFTLLADVLQKGVGYLDPTFFTQPSSSNPQNAGARPAILGTIYLMILLLVMVIALNGLAIIIRNKFTPTR